MNITVTSEVRFCRLPDDSVWANVSPYEFWTRYLDEFEGVVIVGRERLVTSVPSGMVRVDGPGVKLYGVPNYDGAADFVRQALRVRDVVRPLSRDSGALILRLGSLLALALQGALLKSRRPYGVEVVGDPWDTFAPGVVDMPLRGLARGSSPAASSVCAPRRLAQRM